MKKVVVLNRVESYWESKGCKLGCNMLSKKDYFKIEQARKQFFEKTFSEKFNEVSSQGSQFEDEQIYSHNLFEDNMLTDSSGKHGVYRFNETGNNNVYQLYFGPMIIAKKKTGCGSSKGCNLKGLGCKGGSGCKGGIGCKSKGGDNAQELNFYNDELNEKHVSKLNSYFGFRKSFNRDEDDYVYVSDLGTRALNEFVKDWYDDIKAQFEKDMDEIHGRGLSFQSVIDMPSYESMYTNAMLFSNHGQSKIKMADMGTKVNPFKLFLSRFDLWYFPRVKGLFAKIMDVIFLIPIIGWILKMLFGKKDEEILGTDIIEESNIKRLATIYENDFNAQSDAEEQNKRERSEFAEAFLSKFPVTLAFPIKRTFGDYIFRVQRYTFHTFSADGVKA